MHNENALITTESQVEFEALAGAGLEEVRAVDLLVPRLTILQALSPQVNKRRAEHIPGAEIGMIADVGTQEVFPDGILFLPVKYRVEWLEWAPRDTGKGLVSVHRTPEILDRCTRDHRDRPIHDGNLIIETAQFFGLNLSAGRRRCFIPMFSTQLKRARRWVTLAMSERITRSDGTEFQAPLFYRTYRLATVVESNNDGEWFGWQVTRDVAITQVDFCGVDWRQIKQEAGEFRDVLDKERVRPDIGQSAEEAM